MSENCSLILVAMPTRDAITASTVGDLLRLLRRYPNARFAAPIGIYIASLRQMIAEVAVTCGHSHVLFLDADMRFPDDLVGTLPLYNKDIVAANYIHRTMPEICVAHKDGQPVSSVGRTGLERVDFTGCGVMCVKTSVFARLPRPWFDTPYNADKNQFIGEDKFFCDLARAYGYDIWIDHDLSRKVRHQGMIEHRMPEHEMEPVA